MRKSLILELPEETQRIEKYFDMSMYEGELLEPVTRHSHEIQPLSDCSFRLFGLKRRVIHGIREEKITLSRGAEFLGCSLDEIRNFRLFV